MLRGRSKLLWGHTAHLLWITAEVNRDPKKKSSPYKASEFNFGPQDEQAQSQPKKIKMKDLKNLVPAFAELAKKQRGRPSDEQVAALVDRAKRRGSKTRK